MWTEFSRRKFDWCHGTGDKERNSAAEAKISDGARLSHQKLRGEQKRKGETLATTYFPGAFELSKTPDLDLDGEVLKKKDKSQKKSKKLENKNKGNRTSRKNKTTSNVLETNTEEIDFTFDTIDIFSIKFVHDKDIQKVKIVN